MSKNTLKVVLLGGDSVGKSSFMRRYTDKKYYGNLSATIGADFRVTTENVGEEAVKFVIWDTTGHDRSKDTIKICLKGADVIVLMYSAVHEDSYNPLAYWANHVKQAVPGAKVYVVGTKLDIVREYPDRRMIDVSMINSIADEFDCEIYETSARTGENVDTFFKKVAEDFLKSGRENRKTIARHIFQEGCRPLPENWESEQKYNCTII